MAISAPWTPDPQVFMKQGNNDPQPGNWSQQVSAALAGDETFWADLGKRLQGDAQAIPAALEPAGQLLQAAGKLCTPPGPGCAVTPLIEQACRLADSILENADSAPSADLVASARMLLAQLNAVSGSSSLSEPWKLDRGDLVEAIASAEGACDPGQEELALTPLDQTQLLQEYADNAFDLIAAIQRALMEGEATPQASRGAVDTALRAFHTLKGSSAVLGLSQVAGLAHAGETLLQACRDGQILLTPESIDLALSACDALETRIRRISSEEAPDAQADQSLESLVESLEAAAAGNPPPVPEAARTAWPDSAETFPPSQASATGSEATVRVSTARLDALIDLVGELIISHCLAGENPQVRRARMRRRKRSALRKKHQPGPELPERMRADMTRLAGDIDSAGKLVSQLHDLSVSLRMIPLRGIFEKAARLVRDIARKSGKNVQLEISGEDTELDRRMVEMLAAPLMHMIRNAVVHGLEDPDERRRAGKPEQGLLELRAWNEAGEVIVSLKDDGKGLDMEAIRSRAKENNLVANADALSEAQLQELIYHPGLSTAREIDDLAGRGVGMDVVLQNVQAMRGRIEVNSAAAEGTRFRLCLPMTTAVEEVLVLQAGGQRFLLPTRDIQRTFPACQARLGSIGPDGGMILDGDRPVRLLRLVDLCRMPQVDHDARNAQIVLVRQGSMERALLVDALLEHRQVVIKPLGRLLTRVGLFASGAVMGDGKVALALDTRALIQQTPEPTIFEDAGAA